MILVVKIKYVKTKYYTFVKTKYNIFGFIVGNIN